MNKVWIILLALLLSSMYIGQASAEFGHHLEIESFHYGYEPTGLPKVDMLLVNRGTEAENPLIVVTLKKAISSSQDDYIWRKRGTAKSGSIPIILPGAKRFVTMPVDRLLKSGDYKAQMEVKYAGAREARQFEFSVSKDEVNKAVLKLKANDLKIPDGAKLLSRRIGLTAITIAILVALLVAAATFSKFPRALHKRKGQSGPR